MTGNEIKKGIEKMDNALLILLLGVPGVLVATTLHEFTRALLSAALGDNYPKSQGRVTLNPVKHFEPIGFLLMLFSGGFGWGKPVETSALYYKNRKRDTLLVAILPSVINLLVGTLFLGIGQATASVGSPILSMVLSYVAYYNVALAVYNVLPVAPMDCVKVLAVVLPANRYFRYMQNEKLIQMIFLFLLFFNVISGFMGRIIAVVLSLCGMPFGLL